MENWSLNNLEIETYNVKFKDDILSGLRTPVCQRDKFKYNSQIITIPRYFYRYIGVEKDEQSYYSNIIKIQRELKKFDRLFMMVDEGFEKNIEDSLKENLENSWKKICDLPDVKSELIIRILNYYNVFKEFPSTVLTNQIKENLQGLIDYYFECNNDEIDEAEFKNIIFYTISWIHIYMENLFIQFDYVNINPKILYYGEITREEIFFLVFLSTLGCDIIYFNPNDKGDFFNIDKQNIFSNEVLLNKRMAIKPLIAKDVDRVETDAYNASIELEQALHTEDSNFYKPWQFAEYDLKAITLKTTYKEIGIWVKEAAMIRPGFKINDKCVYVPNVFGKVSGTTKNINEYWDMLHQITVMENCLFFKKFPMFKECNNEGAKYYEVYTSNNNSKIDEEKLLNAPWWKYNPLRSGIQRILAQRINELVSKPRVWQKINGKDSSGLDIKIFSKLINLEEPIIQMLQKFDYPQQVPKVVLYKNEENGNLTLDDCIELTFLSSMGVDILVFNPSGYNDIENYIYNHFYDVHILEDMSFNLEYKEKNILKKFFNI